MALHNPIVKSELLAQQSTSIRCLALSPMARTEKMFLTLRARIPRAELLSVPGVAKERHKKEKPMMFAPRKWYRTCPGFRSVTPYFLLRKFHSIYICSNSHNQAYFQVSKHVFYLCLHAQEPGTHVEFVCIIRSLRFCDLITVACNQCVEPPSD
jgi:hypothetical protein